MLQQFSWQQFFMAFTAISLLWYGFVLLVFYPAELRAFFSGHAWRTVYSTSPGHEAGAAAHSTAAQAAEKFTLNPEGLMGSPRQPDGVEVLSSAQVSFADGELGKGEKQAGLAEDVVEQLKEFFILLARSDGGKPEFFRLVENMNEDYGRIGGHPSIGRINAFIRENAPFYISAEELDNLWY